MYGMRNSLRPVADLPEHPSNDLFDVTKDYLTSDDLQTRLSAAEKLRELTGMEPTDFANGMSKLVAPAESPGTDQGQEAVAQMQANGIARTKGKPFRTQGKFVVLGKATIGGEQSWQVLDSANTEDAARTKRAKWSQYPDTLIVPNEQPTSPLVPQSPGTPVVGQKIDFGDTTSVTALPIGSIIQGADNEQFRKSATDTWQSVGDKQSLSQFLSSWNDADFGNWNTDFGPYTDNFGNNLVRKRTAPAGPFTIVDVPTTALPTDAPASPGTDDNAAKSARIAEISSKKADLAKRWRDMKASASPLDQVDAVALDVQIKKLEAERQELARQILQPDAPSAPESPGTESPDTPMGTNELEAKIDDLQSRYDSSLKFWDYYSEIPDSAVAEQNAIAEQIRTLQTQRDAIAASRVELPEPPESPGTTAPLMSKAEFETELGSAIDKAFAAFSGTTPEGWTVKDETSGQVYNESELPFGFAWVVVPDGRSPLARALRRSAVTKPPVMTFAGPMDDKNPTREITIGDSKISVRKHWEYGGYRGLRVSLPLPADASGPMQQSYERKMNAASAFAKHLTSLGFEAYAQGRLD
jgi:hypothetical protein